MSLIISEMTEALLKMCPELRFYDSCSEVERTACRAGALVYFIAFDDLGPVKIGYTSRPKIRFSNIEASAGKRLKHIYLTRPHKNYQHFEGYMHWKLYEHRGIGEWFNLPMERVIEEFHAHKHIMHLYVTPNSDEQIRQCGTY